MKKICLTINGIPLLLWGESSERVIIAVHGDSRIKRRGDSHLGRRGGKGRSADTKF